MTDHDPIDLHGQELAQADRARREKLSAQTEADDMKWLMSGKRGRRILWRLLERAGVHRSSFTGNSETFFREGQRNMGLIYQALVFEHSPESYSVMVAENRTTT
jgi:hypothetical protein